MEAREAYQQRTEVARTATQSDADMLRAMEAVDTTLSYLPERVAASLQALSAGAGQSMTSLPFPPASASWERPHSLARVAATTLPAAASPFPMPSSPGKVARTATLMHKPVLEETKYFDSPEGRCFLQQGEQGPRQA